MAELQSMNKILIIANWKMNPQTLKEAARLLAAAEEVSGKRSAKNLEVIIAAPFTLLPILNQQKKVLQLAGQDCFWEQRGAYTGEVSALMLKEIGCEYAILGHSERREYFLETEEMINKKIKSALSARLKVIFCIGEKMEDRDKIKEVLEGQLKGGLEGIPSSQLANIIVAYEPVWAISTSGGYFCSTDEAFAASMLIRKILINIYNKNAANKAKIIYGGSVDAKEKDAVMYIKEAKMDGVLVGATSLSILEFPKIIEKVSGINV